MKGEKKMEENVMIVPDEEIGVDELEENLTGEVEQRQAEETTSWLRRCGRGWASCLRTAGRRANWTR